MTTQPATPLSELNPRGPLYPFAERIRATTDGTDAVDVWNIPEKTIITMVMVRVVTAGTGSASNFICGDDDDDDGFIVATAIGGATAGSIWGDLPTERGAYLLGATTGHSPMIWKVYEDAGKEIKIDASVALTGELTVDIFVFGYRYDTR